ncbi:MAG: response regulator receiver protein [Acidobacteria bacterium]|nr:response regulator receiver protein [Acidobacteriota bacterium]
MSFDRRVLVVDDDVAIRILIARLLGRMFEVDSARDGAEAIEKLRDHDYAVIILDLMMPRIDGIGVVNYLREHDPDKLSRVIVVTAFGSGAEPRVAPEIARFMAKPFDVGELLREVIECGGGAAETEGKSSPA